MNILITGGAGYIGSALALQLANQSNVNQIVIYDNLVSGQYSLFTSHIAEKPIRFVRADILDNHSLQKAMQNIDVVYHLAAKVVNPDNDSDSQYFEQINNWGTANVVNYAGKANIKQFIYVSSVYVYGQGPHVNTTETIPAPNSFYGISKLRGEEHVHSLPSSVHSTIIRSGSVYGCSPATRYDVLINKLLFESHFFNKVAIHGEGNQIRPFIHISKLVESLSSIFSSTLPAGTYNLVEHNTSVNDILQAIVAHNPQLEYNHVNRHIRMKDVIVQASPELQDHIPYTPATFNEEIQQFIQRFW